MFEYQAYSYECQIILNCYRNAYEKKSWNRVQNSMKLGGKGKAVPLQTWTGPGGIR
jgi:hypothetical protein